MRAALQQQFVAGSKVGMDMGMNLGVLSSWSNVYPFANVCWNIQKFEQAVGSGSWSQSQGVITASVGTDQFRGKISEAAVSTLPSGTYTVLNPSGAKIAIGNYTSPAAYAAWTTATQFTFSYTPSPLLVLWVEGSTPMGSGPIQIIKPGLLSAYQAGEIFDPEFVSFHSTLGTKVLRVMDWTNASENIETDWTDRSLTGKVTFYNSPCRNVVVPWEILCNLANRLDKDLWICVPTRATPAYMASLATLMAANLNTSRKLYVELGNELWNYGNPWVDGVVWTEMLDHTRYTATANFGANTYTLASHGLSANTPLRGFGSRENNAALADAAWQTYIGNPFASPIDANTFQVLDTSGGSVLPVAARQVNIVYSRTDEVGKVADLEAHVGERSLTLWAAFEAAMAAHRLVKVLPSWSVSPAKTTAIAAVAGSEADAVATAPYYYGMWWGVAADQADTQVTPKLWASVDGTWHAGLYSVGSTPTTAQIIAGTGAGFLSKYSAAYSDGPSTYTSGTAFTGLVNGTTYRLCFAFEDSSSGLDWQIGVNVVPAVSPSTVTAEDTYANQNLRNRLHQLSSVADVDAHEAVSGGLPIIAYEGQMHLHHGAPGAVSTWLYAYLNSAEFADGLNRYYADMATRGCKLLCFYSDVSTNMFRLVDSYSDTADQRFIDFAANKGTRAAGSQITISDILAPDIEVEPSYPTTVYTLPAGNTYQILDGDTNGNFDVSGNLLRIVNGTGVTWATPATKTLDMYGYSADSADRFNVQFALGSSWYPADAKYAWDSTADADTTQINPVVGGALTKTAGSGDPAVADSLWDLAATFVYSNTTNPYSAAIQNNVPFLIAAVLDIDDETDAYQSFLRVGSAPYVDFATQGGGPSTHFGARHYSAAGVGDAIVKFTTGTVTTGKKVYWTYGNYPSNEVIAGINQTDGETATGKTMTVSSFANSLYVGSSSAATARSNMKHGSFVVVNRSGMTLAQAKAIVAKIQAHHGIA